VNLVGFIIRIYHDARSRERQIQYLDMKRKAETDLLAVSGSVGISSSSPPFYNTTDSFPGSNEVGA